MTWLVVTGTWLDYFPWWLECHHPNWLRFFQRGWSHQPDQFFPVLDIFNPHHPVDSTGWNIFKLTEVSSSFSQVKFSFENQSWAISQDRTWLKNGGHASDGRHVVVWWVTIGMHSIYLGSYIFNASCKNFKHSSNLCNQFGCVAFGIEGSVWVCRQRYCKSSVASSLP